MIIVSSSPDIWVDRWTDKKRDPEGSLEKLRKKGRYLLKNPEYAEYQFRAATPIGTRFQRSLIRVFGEAEASNLNRIR